MRRALLAVTLGGVLLSAAACDSGSEAPAAAPAPTTAAPVATSPEPNYAENTALVCGKVKTIFSTGLEQNFGTQMGKMIAYKQAKQTAEAEAAEKAAAAQLKDIGVKVKKETAAAEDPELKAAGETTAAKFTKSATDSKYFDSIKTQKDMDKTIEAKMTDWLSPVSGYCR
jgi:hypothetical protein